MAALLVTMETHWLSIGLATSTSICAYETGRWAAKDPELLAMSFPLVSTMWIVGWIAGPLCPLAYGLFKTGKWMNKKE